ncbi:MAG: hypothetical protein ACYCXQ_06045 [Candidatus Humimicrobiaceae bacterium]
MEVFSIFCKSQKPFVNIFHTYTGKFWNFNDQTRHHGQTRGQVLVR